MIEIVSLELRTNAKEKELEKLCDEFPTFIPIERCAKFLSLGVNHLKQSLALNLCSFGFAHKENNEYVFRIPMIAFYNFVKQIKYRKVKGCKATIACGEKR